MMGTMTDVAEEFVDLALKYEYGQWWKKGMMLVTDEIQVLFRAVSAAGFNPKQVVVKKLIGFYHDEDRHKTDETFPINNLCPCTVVDEEDHDDYFATGWLDCALQRVVWDGIRSKESRDQLITVIAREIKRSVPLKPMQLTPIGDVLDEYPRKKHASGGLAYFVDHTRDEHKLEDYIGVHRYCNGLMERHRATERHDAMVCRKCHLRVLFPKQYKTYGELRQTFSSY